MPAGKMPINCMPLRSPLVKRCQAEEARLKMATATKNKHLRAKRQKKKLFRANEPLLSVLMWGVNHSIQELSHINIPVMLMPDDFKAFSKVKVDNQYFNKENLPSHFKVKEYCPLVFKNLRERFNIDDVDYMNSLTRSQPVNTDSPGRSGARFLMSYDKKYVIKTIESEEVAQMHHLPKQYHQHIVENHSETLLPHYLGMYRLTVEGTETYLVVMANIFSHKLNVHIKYDLKGSTVDRQASDKEKAKELPTYKDNDFVKERETLKIGETQKERLLGILKRDSDFLVTLNLMDYSLLLGVHDVERAEQEDMEMENQSGDDEDGEDSGGQCATPPDSPRIKDFEGYEVEEREVFAIKSANDAPKKEIYFMGLIDILTSYDAKKRAAHAAKTVKHGAASEISTVKPKQYARRFMDFMDKVLV
ncbi:PREDICTED: phosphatidylinositol 5-phosphate 4-kinase type-2 alpha-like isoform X1 [Branchiostoma belcheri]|uniref:1-phosphatidylinositol-5-phosphate 4-kinase n=1 Tax=Branchiostoma belcheri TaxID=7741 RepID=A0A6P4ZGU9_BRABE|nr:PREDICTED: phosphatidylinositol 5-phosphate 4-kinase type-2 alpha-like isoform X1 [Branchiostoma belcheri]XP_019635979.1 PREDICTED: phosphatidylinositol 5-phosphate 4-kinase type-2 alpha-like isoform X1 [Branchiostoma belcheri]